ncbi:MAG: hypothetical protein E6I56_12410 [Chloroflexi bacterium]|nr:MAG: hypothetical protein E6I56_12410 [Chloroflexota bacterium]
MKPLPLIGTAVGLLVLFGIAEFGRRHGVGAETTRRVVHITGAGTTALFPLYLSLVDVAVLAVVFTVFLAWTRLRHALLSVHAVARPTLGAIVFPIGLLVAAVILWPHPAAFSYAALMLALPDAGAALIGERFPSWSWSVVGGHKSLFGSLTFFVLAVGIGTAFGLLAGNGAFLAAAGVALTVAAVEGAVGYGLDNLFIPLAAGVLGEQWLGL